MTSGEKVNLTIVVGLLLIAIGCVIDGHLLAIEGKDTKDTLFIVTSISSGLVGFLSRELKQLIAGNNNKVDEA